MPSDQTDQLAPVRRTILFAGRVQGVGFRYTTHQVASRFSLTGTVRNLPDGRVELVVEAASSEADSLVAAVEWAMAGHIQETKISETPATGEFSDFRVIA